MLDALVEQIELLLVGSILMAESCLLDLQTVRFQPESLFSDKRIMEVLSGLNSKLFRLRLQIKSLYLEPTLLLHEINALLLSILKSHKLGVEDTSLLFFETDLPLQVNYLP